MCMLECGQNVDSSTTKPHSMNATGFMQFKVRGQRRQKHALKNCTPVARGMIEPSINNGFPTRSGRKRQLEMLDLDSGLIGL